MTHTSFNCILTFSDADPQWSDWVSPWVSRPNDAGGYSAWQQADPTDRQIIITQNLVPDAVVSASPTGWEQQCASGAFDSYDQQLAQNLVNAQFGDAVIRLAHEMNGTWYNDSLPGTTAAEDAAWVTCWQTVVTEMRSVAGAHFLFDWNVNPAVRAIPLANYYPGDSYVDIIGIDLYDQGGNLPAVGNPNRWNALVSATDSLNDVEAFAVAHNKPLSFPEWGTVTTQGDDPTYVTDLAQFIATHDVAYQSWFDGATNSICQLELTSCPQSVAAYAAAFG